MSQVVKKQEHLDQLCLHCGQDIPENYSQSSFCCMGCRAVYHLIHDQGMERFYDLKTEKTLPLIYYGNQKTKNWLSQEKIDGGEIELSIEGIHCAACIWLLQNLAQKFGGAEVKIIPDLAKMNLVYDPKKFRIIEYINIIERMGYGVSEYSDHQIRSGKGLLIRLGLAWAIAINIMFFSITLYLGVEGKLAQTFHHLNFGLGILSVLIGGSYFFKKAWLGLKHKVLHFDLPISLGILAAGIGSAYSYLSSQYQYSYFDSLAMFVALMLTGRYLQEQLLLKNTNQSLKFSSFSDYQIFDLENHRQISYPQIQSQDHLLVKSGEFIPVRSELIFPEKIQINLSSISGESKPKLIHRGEIIPAGAILLSDQAIEIKSLEKFSGSLLYKLGQNLDVEKALPGFWQKFSGYYVIAVISLSIMAFGIWSFIDITKATQVLISLLVVTCPCAIGIAMPLAFSMANRFLVSKGIFIKSLDLFEKIKSIRSIFFDKTGTLTLSELSIQNSDQIDQLKDSEKEVLFNLSLRSLHPVSKSIYQYLLAHQLSHQTSFEAKEIVGEGVSVQYRGHDYFLGKIKSQDQNKYDYQAGFYKDNQLLVHICFKEEVLNHSRESISKLYQDKYQVYMMSGDREEKVRLLGSQLGIFSQNIYSNCDPFIKLDLIDQRDDQNTFMIGDGLNDTKALERAYLSACPLSSTRTLLSDRVDLFYVSKSLSWINDLFSISKKLNQVQRFNLKFIILYNVTMISLASLGWVSPLLCAVVMPLSSLVVIGLTSFQMQKIQRGER